MNRRWLALLLICAVGLASCNSPAPRPTYPRHTATGWHFKTAMAYEAAGLVNLLTGDLLYTRYYPIELAALEARYTPELRQAKDHLAALRKETGRHLSGFLGIYFSAVDAETLDDAIAIARDPDRLKARLQELDRIQPGATPYFTDSDWQFYQRLLPDLRVVLDFLRQIDFPGLWDQQFGPHLRPQIEQMQQAAQEYDVIPAVESRLGFGLPDDRITVYVVYFLKPLGHHVIGTRFLTQGDLPEAEKHIVRTAIHEMMHPPFDNADRAVWDAFSQLRQDPLVQSTFEHRNPAFSYNTWDYYANEDSVRALEQLISESEGVARPLTTRFGPSEDEGMHVLSGVLYGLMRNEGFPRNGEGYAAFLTRMNREGKLAPGKAEAVYRQYFDG